ncbi:MAG: HEPN domain-containing protein [Desulfurococcaceae archaeon]
MSYELLKKRALSFLRNAKNNFDQGDYDLTLFHVEQFIQLYSKYLLYRRIGDYPKTHSIIRLLKDLVRVYGGNELKDLIDSNLEALYLLEESYISSRYLPREYDHEIASRVLKLSEKVLEVFKCLESR